MLVKLPDDDIGMRLSNCITVQSCGRQNTMEKWEAAARKFIGQCEFYNDIEAVFLTGSYAAGSADKSVLNHEKPCG